MDKLQFQFKVVATADGKSNMISITSISTQDGKTFCLPKEDQEVKKHTLIVASTYFAKIQKSLKKRHHERKIWITLSNEMRNVYLDDDENLQFNNEYLEEINESIDQTSKKDDSTLITLLEKLIENTHKSEEKSLTKITQEFMIEKFDSKTTNAHQWISEFEKECTRADVIQDKKKIEALKLFLDKPYLNWYSCMLLKLSINSEWDIWKKNFCETFANKGWSPIRYAMSFKYQSGSLVDYAIKKEKLLLEIRKSIDTGTLIDLIAIGLPNFIADKINREEIETTEELCNELGRLEHFAQKKITHYEKNKNERKNDKTPCGICKSKGKNNRFHEEEKCWFKDRSENTSLINVEEFDDAKNF